MHILFGCDFEAYPIPPKPVRPSAKKCNHTLDPPGYTHWHEWAEKASKTHRQVRCPRCGLFAIWMPKAQAKAHEKRELEKAIAESERCKAEALAELLAKKAKRTPAPSREVTTP